MIRALLPTSFTFLGFAASVFGVVFINPDTTNTTAPTGQYANSGWDYQGQWGSFLGTAIAPNAFVTAKHINFLYSVGDTFTYQGTNYTTTAKFEDASSDLTIWQVSGTFPNYAPLYTAGQELGKELVVFGRGREKGNAVTVNAELKGWEFGAWQNTQRWGTNTVSGYADGGLYLTADFNQTGGANEAHLSEGDSGGAVFIQEAGIWKLAAINYAIDGPYSTSATGAGSFNATLFDRGGLYQSDGVGWQLITESILDKPSAFYSTRISERIDWVQSTIPEPARISFGYAIAIGLAVILGSLFRRGYRR
ncbi:MAG: hypothetical protein SFY80_08985 [Verrucomicrobiota bacterium]|nr:hypothetical protein [Verrucomicrobiota bacterium]